MTKETEKQLDELWNTVAKQKKRIAELEKENAELKKENQKWKDGIALKDEEIGCIETDFNTFKSKAKEIIKDLCGMVRELNKPNVQLTNIDYSLSEAEQFLKDCEVE